MSIAVQQDRIWLRSNHGASLSAVSGRASGERGFTLLEAVIGLVLMMIVALGSASLFSFSVYNNSGGSERATSLAIAQQAMERLRSATFNSTTTAAALAGGSNTQTGVIRDFRTYTVTVTVDDDPSTLGIEIIPTTNFKRITIAVTPETVGRGWAFGAGGTVSLITERSRTDR